MMQEITSNTANETLVKELLDLMVNDSENLERTMKLLTDDCVWVLEPGGTEYHGTEELKTFIEIAMSTRTHDSQHKVEVLNWFLAGENLCVEYTHGLLGKVGGFKGKVKTGALRYCMAYHLREGKIDRVHEYINASSWWLNFLLPVGLAYLHRQVKKKMAQAEGR